MAPQQDRRRKTADCCTDAHSGSAMGVALRVVSRGSGVLGCCVGAGDLGWDETYVRTAHTPAFLVKTPLSLFTIIIVWLDI